MTDPTTVLPPKVDYSAGQPPSRPVAKPLDEKPAKVTKEDRVRSLLKGYAHALEHNSPRTPAEYAELRFLLGDEGAPDPQAIPFIAHQKADAAKAQAQVHV